MLRNQWIAIIATLLLFVVMYFGCDVKPAEHKAVEKQRLDNAESTSISSLLLSAKEEIPSTEGSSIMSLEVALNDAAEKTEKVDAFKALSSAWYRLEQPAIAGHYAEEIANLENNEEAWSIAGTTFSICVQKAKEEKVRQYCTDHAVSALENAASLNPSNLQHQVNLALVYTESPPADNPMKGVLMLVNLNKQNPENVSVLNQLGRLAIKTGQFQKATERLGKAVEIEPGNTTSNCLLAKAFEEMGEQEKAAPFQRKCQSLMSK